MSKILDLLEPSAVILNHPAADSAEIISLLGGKLFEAGYVHESFVAGALEREQSMPTGLPLGGTVNAAIPHTEIQHVRRAGLALGTLTTEVPFRNMVSPEEEVPVRIVFLMALDQPKAQVEMLMQVSSLLQNENVIQKIIQAQSYEEVRAAIVELEQADLAKN